MLSPDALTTVPALKAELSIPAEDSSKDELLARAIEAASDAIRRYCHRDFARKTVTEQLVGHGTASLIVSLTPIVTVDSIELYGEAVPLEDVAINATAGLITRRYGVWPEAVAPNVVVTYMGGYVTPAQADADPGLTRDLPHDIEAACLIIAATRIQSMGQPVDAQILQVEQIRVHWSEGGRQGIPQQAAMLLEPYVRWA